MKWNKGISDNSISSGDGGGSGGGIDSKEKHQINESNESHYLSDQWHFYTQRRDLNKVADLKLFPAMRWISNFSFSLSPSLLSLSLSLASFFIFVALRKLWWFCCKTFFLFSSASFCPHSGIQPEPPFMSKLKFKAMLSHSFQFDCNWKDAVCIYETEIQWNVSNIRNEELTKICK